MGLTDPKPDRYYWNTSPWSLVWGICCTLIPKAQMESSASFIFRSGPDGTYQLPDANGHLYDVVLWARPRLVWSLGTCRTVGRRPRHLDLPIDHLTNLAEALSVRAHGVAVAIVDLQVLATLAKPWESHPDHNQAGEPGQAIKGLTFIDPRSGRMALNRSRPPERG